ncbi:YaaL family protein [Clostridium sp. 19966]|nr:YaaL family protein [Clostridium sp. 19966]
MDTSMEENELIKAIEDSINEIEAARSFFNSVSDSKLIDYAIFTEQAATARYSYLISEAKRLNIKTKHIDILKEISAI